ncbi:hypothetical protein ACLMJK_009690 [Lecanora helva]
MPMGAECDTYTNTWGPSFQMNTEPWREPSAYFPSGPHMTGMPHPAGNDWPGHTGRPLAIAQTHNQTSIHSREFPLPDDVRHLNDCLGHTNILPAYDDLSVISKALTVVHSPLNLVNQSPGLMVRKVDSRHGKAISEGWAGTDIFRPDCAAHTSKEQSSQVSASETPGFTNSEPAQRNEHRDANKGQEKLETPEVPRRSRKQKAVHGIRKKRRLSPKTRDHAKKIRQHPKGACGECKRKKTKVRVLPYRVALGIPNFRSVITGWRRTG